MAKIGFTVSTPDGGGADLGDLLVPRNIFSEGGLWTWGKNINGELGDSTISNRSSPVQTIAGGTNWKQVSSGANTIAAIKTDGTLWLWGLNLNGNLGDSTTTGRSSPIQTIVGGNNWKQVSLGYSSTTTAIKTDGTLWLWGSNINGELGDSTTSNRSSPIQTIAGGNNWKQVSCGNNCATAIKTDGTLWLWGNNSSGQLGDSTISNRSSPIQTIAGGTNWKQVSLGYRTVAAIKTDGTLWLWGDNSSGQLGDSTISNRSSPIQTIAGGTNWKQVSAGDRAVAAIKTDGTLWLWGYNQTGALGDSTSISRSSPIQTIAGGTNWKQVSNDISGGWSTGAIKTDGTLWLWGTQSSPITFTYGNLGDNTLTNRTSPVQTIAGGTNWKQVSLGGNMSAAIKDDM